MGCLSMPKSPRRSPVPAALPSPASASLRLQRLWPSRRLVPGRTRRFTHGSHGVVDRPRQLQRSRQIRGTGMPRSSATSQTSYRVPSRRAGPRDHRAGAIRTVDCGWAISSRGWAGSSGPVSRRRAAFLSPWSWCRRCGSGSLATRGRPRRPAAVSCRNHRSAGRQAPR
jgi:hypothetical protein